MSRINREIELTHNGKTKTVVATTRLIARIDGELKTIGPDGFMGTLSRMEKAVSAAQNDPNSTSAADFPVFSLAVILTMLLREAKFVVSEDDVCDDLIEDLQSNNAQATSPILERLFAVVTPPGSEEKNPPAPARSGRKKKAA